MQCDKVFSVRRRSRASLLSDATVSRFSSSAPSPSPTTAVCDEALDEATQHLSQEHDDQAQTVKHGSSAKAPLRCGRRSPQGLCSLTVGCKTCEEDSVEDKEGVHVLGVVK